jgi:hypothetical protein
MHTGEVELQLHISLTSAQNGSEWSAFCLGCFNPRNKQPLSLCGRFGGPTAGLDSLQKRYISRQCREANHDWPIEASKGGHAVICTGLVVIALKECLSSPSKGDRIALRKAVKIMKVLNEITVTVYLKVKQSYKISLSTSQKVPEDGHKTNDILFYMCCRRWIVSKITAT